MISMNKKYLFILLLFLVNCTFAQVKQTVTKSTVKFEIKNMGFNTSGTIGGVQAAIVFDPAKAEAGSIEASAEVATLNTDNDLRDEHLRSDSFFDAVKFPKITIKSVSLKHKSGNNYTGQFSVTIKDKTKILEMPFTYTENGSSATFNGILKLKRADFGLGSSSMVLSDDVKVTIEVETNK